MDKKPLVIIGLDGTDWSLINPWIDSGKLPTFKKIKTEGIFSNMISTIPPITGPALASFFTGYNPGNTGITSFIKANGGVISYKDIRDSAIWDYLGAAGISSCVVGLRLTYPPKRINGIMLSGGFLSSKGDDYIQPEDYLAKTKGYHPDTKTYPVLLATLKKGLSPDPGKITDELIILTKKQFAIFENLRRSENFLFSLLWIENTDLLQHFCWHRPMEILRLYQCLDTLIGKFVEKNPDINLMMMSDHGFHSIPDRSFYINGWLMEQGYLKSKHTLLRGFSKIKYHFRKVLSGKISHLQKRRIRLFLERFDYKRLMPGQRSETVPFMVPLKGVAKRCNFEPDSVIAYSLEKWGIRISSNVKGEDYEKIRGKLISEMKTLLDDKGMSVFSLVFRKEEIYSGKFIKDMPDIIFLIDSHFYVDTYTSNKRFSKYNSLQQTTGSHDQAYLGIMMAFGPDIKTDVSLKEIRIIDFLPTILDYFNISYPDSINGKSMAEIFSIGKHDEKKKKVVLGENINGANAYTPDEELEIKQNLRNLGYL